MCKFLLLWDRRGRFTRPDRFHNPRPWKVYPLTAVCALLLVNSQAANHAHDDEKCGDTDSELEKGFLKSATRALN